MRTYTVKDLAQACVREIKKGNGDKTIMITSDDEGNGYYYLWYLFSTVEEMEEPITIGNKEIKNEFEFADERIAKKEDTILLG